MIFNDVRFYLIAIDISELLDVSTTTIRRWYNNGEVDKKGNKYNIADVYKRHKFSLEQKVNKLREKNTVGILNQKKKSLQEEKIIADIRVIQANIEAKEFELQQLHNNLVVSQEATRSYKNGCEHLHDSIIDFPQYVSEKLSILDNPNDIQALLQEQINQLLVKTSEQNHANI